MSNDRSRESLLFFPIKVDENVFNTGECFVNRSISFSTISRRKRLTHSFGYLSSLFSSVIDYWWLSVSLCNCLILQFSDVDQNEFTKNTSMNEIYIFHSDCDITDRQRRHHSSMTKLCNKRDRRRHERKEKKILRSVIKSPTNEIEIQRRRAGERETHRERGQIWMLTYISMSHFQVSLVNASPFFSLL